MLALSNGYLGLRGTLDEGVPAALPGTYLAGFHETRPISYADRGAGDPDVDQVLVDVADGTRIALIVEGEPLDLRTGTIVEHERLLDLRAGMLVRRLRWRSPAGHEIFVRSRRLVSLAHRELAVITYEVEALGRPLQLTVLSDLAVRSPGDQQSADPRAGGVLPPDTLVARRAERSGRRALLVHQTQGSRFLVAAGIRATSTARMTASLRPSTFRAGTTDAMVMRSPSLCYELRRAAPTVVEPEAGRPHHPVDSELGAVGERHRCAGRGGRARPEPDAELARRARAGPDERLLVLPRERDDAQLHRPGVSVGSTTMADTPIGYFRLMSLLPLALRMRCAPAVRRP